MKINKDSRLTVVDAETGKQVQITLEDAGDIINNGESIGMAFNQPVYDKLQSAETIRQLSEALKLAADALEESCYIKGSSLKKLNAFLEQQTEVTA